MAVVQIAGGVRIAMALRCRLFCAAGGFVPQLVVGGVEGVRAGVLEVLGALGCSIGWGCAASGFRWLGFVGCVGGGVFAMRRCRSRLVSICRGLLV